MARHALPLVLLAPALLLLAAACSHTPPRPTLAQREAQCAPVWKAVHAEIDARGSTCAADWECRQVRPEYLGCDAWANVDFKLSEGRIMDLENACAPISFGRECGKQVGACSGGRCTGRPPIRDSAACIAAGTALAKRLEAPFSCRADAECVAIHAGEGKRAGPADWRSIFAREEAALAEACPGGGPDGVPEDSRMLASCVQGTCSLQEPGDALSRRYKKPVELVPGCIARSFGWTSDLAGVPGQVTFKFKVSKRGIPYSFVLLTEGSVELLRALADATSSCAFEPGRIGDDAVEIWMVVPIRFQSG